MDLGSPCHPPLGSEPSLYLCQFSFHPQSSQSVALIYAGHLGSNSGFLGTHRIVRHFTDKEQLKRICGWNTINSILSLRTCINPSIILLPTILFSHLLSILFRTFQILHTMIITFSHLTITLLVGIIFPGPITCSIISAPVAFLN